MMNAIQSQLQKLKTWFEEQSKRRKDEFIANTAMGKPVRIIGALMPMLAFAIVVRQAVPNIETDATPVSSNLQWEVEQYNVEDSKAFECLESRCWEQAQPLRRFGPALLQSQDPLSTLADNGAKWDVSKGQLIRYKAEIPAQDVLSSKAELLHIPGLIARRVKVWVNGTMVIDSPGRLPYFIDLRRQEGNGPRNVEIVALVRPDNRFYQGFIRKPHYIGNVLSIYRTHVSMMETSFPRRAVVIFLLSIGALTFAFFIFLDHKRELFALGLTVSLLGAAEAVRNGIHPLGPNYLFVLWTMHVTALAWYATELIRFGVGLPKKTFLAGLSIIALYFIHNLVHQIPEFLSGAGVVDPSNWLQQLAAALIWLYPDKDTLLAVVDFVPFLYGLLCLSVGTFLYSKARDRAISLIIAASTMIFYSLFWYYNDFRPETPLLPDSLHEIPILVIVTTWVISALSSLGSMEKRIQIAVKDRETRLKLEHEIILAQEVQQSFIATGQQDDPNYEVYTIYQAVKKVGGDWVKWVRLNETRSLGIIGDVVGKGVQAGLIVSAVDSILRSILPDIQQPDRDPEYILKSIVDAIFHSVIQPHESRAMTLMILVVDENGKMTYASCGHPPMLSVGKEKTRVFAKRTTWLSPDFDPNTLKIGTETLEEDEIIIGYTDGVCDGSRELRQFKKRVIEWRQRPLSDINDEFMAVEPTYDDQTLLLVRKRSMSLDTSLEPHKQGA